MTIKERRLRERAGFRTPGRSPLAITQRLTARGIGILGGAVLIAGLLGMRPAHDHDQLYAGTIHLDLDGLATLEPHLDSLSLALDAAEAALARARTLIDYSARFNIEADLAAKIYDTAIDEGIDPEVGFRVVYVESRFNPRAKSVAGAIGLAQVLPSTARFFDPGITVDGLYEPDVNLRIGFRYLNDLLIAFDGDLPLALTAYNRGPTRLRQLLANGVEPWNGYARSVLRGYDPPMTSFTPSAQ